MLFYVRVQYYLYNINEISIDFCDLPDEKSLSATSVGVDFLLCKLFFVYLLRIFRSVLIR